MSGRREQIYPLKSSTLDGIMNIQDPLGTVTLSIVVGNYPQQITKDVTFLVVDCSSACNAILRRPPSIRGRL